MGSGPPAPTPAPQIGENNMDELKEIVHLLQTSLLKNHILIAAIAFRRHQRRREEG